MNHNIYQIQAYFEGTLSPEEMRDLEERALNDTFLAEAMDGYAYNSTNAGAKVSLLQQKLYAQVAKRNEQKGMFGTTAHRLSIALVAAVILICLAVLLWLRRSYFFEKQNPEHIHKNIEIEWPNKR